MSVRRVGGGALLGSAATWQAMDGMPGWDGREPTEMDWALFALRALMMIGGLIVSLFPKE
jgi:hypothetical protein